MWFGGGPKAWEVLKTARNQRQALPTSFCIIDMKRDGEVFKGSLVQTHGFEAPDFATCSTIHLSNGAKFILHKLTVHENFTFLFLMIWSEIRIKLEIKL